MDGLVAIIISVVAYAAALLFTYKRVGLNLGTLLLAFYVFVAFMCAYYASMGLYTIKHFMLWPLLYYIIVVCIFVKPFCTRKQWGQNINIRISKRLYTFCDFYIIITLLYILFMLSSIRETIASGEWVYKYVEMREDDVEIYHNVFEKIVFNCASYLKIPALLIGFYLFANHSDYRHKSILIVCPFLCSFAYAMYMASRTNLFIIILLYGCTGFLFWNQYSPKIKQVITSVFALIISLVVILCFAITLSRFGDDDISWLANYFGGSYRIAHNTIGFTERLGYGSNFFSDYYNFMGIKMPVYHCLIDDENGFHPMAAMRFTDFGFFGTLIYAFLVCRVMTKLLSARKIHFGCACIVLYYYQDLLMGALYDNTTAWTWTITLCVNLILNFYLKYD